MNAGDRPVTVDTLDAALARLELRLGDKFAPITLVAGFVTRTEIKQIITEVLHESEARGWTKRDSLLAVVGIVFVALNFVLGLYIAAKAG